MTTDIKDYNDLTGLLLGPIRTRPAMYLGEAKISKLQNFILGYSMATLMASRKDKYFDDPGFLDWFIEKYNIKKSSSWEKPFLDEAKNDEEKALELFFKYLEEYSKETL